MCHDVPMECYGHIHHKSYIHHILQSSETSQSLEADEKLNPHWSALVTPSTSLSSCSSPLVVPTLPAFDPYPLASNWITMILILLMIQAYTSVLFGLVPDWLTLIRLIHTEIWNFRFQPGHTKPNLSSGVARSFSTVLYCSLFEAI